jgi:hypothetical protein
VLPEFAWVFFPVKEKGRSPVGAFCKVVPIPLSGLMARLIVVKSENHVPLGKCVLEP